MQRALRRPLRRAPPQRRAHSRPAHTPSTFEKFDVRACATPFFHTFCEQTRRKEHRSLTLAPTPGPPTPPPHVGCPGARNRPAGPNARPTSSPSQHSRHATCTHARQWGGQWDRLSRYRHSPRPHVAFQPQGAVLPKAAPSRRALQHSTPPNFCITASISIGSHASFVVF